MSPAGRCFASGRVAAEHVLGLFRAVTKEQLAQPGDLPLLGGNTGHSAPYGFHEWEYLLGETGLLHLDHALARASHLLGSLVMLLALGWGAWLLWRHYRQLERGG